jgi:hypothetical protein
MWLLYIESVSTTPDRRSDMELDIHELDQDLEELKAQRAAVEQERFQVQCKLEDLDKTLHRIVKLQTIYEHCLTALANKDAVPQTTGQSTVELIPHKVVPTGFKTRPAARKVGPRPMRVGTIKHNCYLVLKEQRGFLFPREIYEILAAKGIQFRYPRPIEMVASVLKTSMKRKQGIFAKNRAGKFGLAEWKEEQNESDNSESNDLTRRNGSDTMRAKTSLLLEEL